jgi:hypothetical protein
MYHTATEENNEELSQEQQDLLLNTSPRFFLNQSYRPINKESKQEYQQTNNKQPPWPESASELYRRSDRRLSANLVQVLI